jgi:hypothetical protein
MNLGLYGILILLGLFIVLLVFNPNISCFGKKLKSPFYPLFRKKTRRKVETEDYGFNLGGGKRRTPETDKTPKKRIPVEDYGFDLGKTGRKKSLDEESGPKEEKQ